MKKAITLILAFVMMLLLCSCTYYNQVQENGFSIMNGSSFPLIIPFPWNPDGSSVYCYTWDGDENNTDIVIPDKYKFHTIRKLGGFFARGVPLGFYIDTTDWMNLQPDDERAYGCGYQTVPYYDVEIYSDEWSEIVYLDFNLYIGKNIDGIMGFPHVRVYTVDGVNTAYCARVTVYCDEENETFYSKDGRLYYRETDELVEEFIYAE